MNGTPFLVCKNGNIGAENKWFRHCKAGSIPHIVVRIRRKYAEVDFDCISIPPNRDASIRRQEEVIKSRLVDVFRRYSGKKSTFQFTCFEGSMENMPLETAEVAAHDVYAVLMDALLV